MNVDIFVCVNFRAFNKMDNYNLVYHNAILSRCTYMNDAKICTLRMFTVYKVITGRPWETLNVT